jgi:hypothetical protein
VKINVDDANVEVEVEVLGSGNAYVIGYDYYGHGFEAH